MKTKVKRMSKRTLALFLGILMLVTSIGVGSIITANAAGITGTAYLYVKTNPDSMNWWNNDGCGRLYLFGGTSAAKGPYDGTVVTINSVSYKRFEIPSGGNYTKFILSRSYNGNDWNEQTGNMTLSTTQNAVTNFGKDWTSPTWSTVQYTSVASLSASKTSASTGENVTLTPGISTNTTYNAYKSVAYSISPSSGASISGNTFTATSAGTYTVTATVTYNAKGYTGITKTATATSTITVTQAATNYTGITAAAKGTTDGTSYSVDLGSIQSSTTVSSATGLPVSAPPQSGYTFYKWVASGSGTFDNANNASTTFHPAANSEVATAQYKKNYTISKNTPTGGSVTLSNTSRVAGETYTVTLSASSGYRFKSLTVGGTDVTSSVSSNKYTGTAKGTSDTIAVVATYEAIPATTIYVKKTLASTFSNIHIWSNTSDNWTGAWPGQALSGWSSTTDGKYYYKSFNQDYSTFKFILNNNSSPQTSDSDAYATGKSYYIDSATASQKAVLTEGEPKASTITYNTGTGYTIGGTKPTSAYTGETVSFTVTASSGYRIDKVQYTPAGGTATTITASSGTYSFTMPDKNVTVSVTAVKTYTVTLSAAGTGMGTTKQYFVGTTPGTYSNYSSAITVDAGSTVYFKVSYATGYEYDTVTNATVYTANTVFKTAAINADTTVTITAKKISHSVSVDAKYSTNGTTFATDFPSGSKPAVTIAANTATQLDGVAVSAPATDPTGYVFAGWATNAGNTTTTYFANYLDKDTTFKPNASNTTAIARYKKIFKITSSVDNTGTGAGTVTTTKTSVEAGGSYTITASAKSGSAVESVKVNGTAKTATASQTISSVSADQTVVVKFKSNVYLKGTMNATAWAGDVMQANTAGTSYTKSEVVLNAGTTYEFKHWVDSGGNGTYSTTVGTWTLNNIATHSTKSDGYGGTNLTITPSVKAKVTFVSDGTKFTSITAIPSDSTTYNVTLTQSADYTITSTYMGVEYTTAGKNANVTVPVYSGTGFSYTVTPASGKYLSGVAQSESVALSPAFSATTHANSYTGTVSSVSNAFAVSATAASKLTVAAKTNKSARGTVSVNKTSAAPGESITITVSPKNGVLKSLTCTYANGAVYTCNLSTKKWTITTNATSASIKKGSAIKKTLLTGADTTYTMTIAENSAATINATFDAYSGESTWYYNGYDNSGNALSGYHTKQMTEGMVGGNKFSYYHVEGRSGTDQLMTVSDGVPSSGTRYVYFVRPNNYGDGWSASNNPKAHFWKNGGQDYDTWPGTEMSWQWNNDYGQGVYKIAIPDGADRVSFNDATNNGQHQTIDIDLTTTSGAYYVGEWNSTYSKYNYGTWDTGWADQGWVASGTEYFYQNSTHNGDYTGDFNTKGFYNHNTASKLFAKPKDLGTNTGDYYINVLYPNTTYTINGVTKKTGSNPMIIWSAEPLAGDDENVKIYAKDGAIRAETFGSTYANIADTKIYAADGTTTVGTKQNGSITNQTYEIYNAAKGDTIVIKTQIGATDSSNLSNAAALKAKYYVRGFCVNGEVSELLEPNDTGVYTLTYKVPEDAEFTKVEITPIYYLKDTSANPIVTYRVTGFTDELKAVGTGKPGWGDTLYTYPYYGKLGGQNNAFGAYPGQPMVYYKGQYQMQIPQKSTAWDPYQVAAATVNNTTVSGITMSNGYWDSVHKQIMGYGDNSTSADHVQTYDYGDFYKIFNEKKPVDNIVFDFKYRTKKHNLTDIITTSTTASALNTIYGDTNGNGFELLTNFHGRNVDLFGTPLSGEQLTATPVYVVSTGGVIDNQSGVENIAGYYATEWVVYGSSDGTSYSRISAGNKNSIPPEVLVLNDDDDTSFSDTTYPSADANHTLTGWKALYTALEAYRGKPVMISYEAADAQQGQGLYYTGTGGATRNDGRWLYSKTGENITSNIKIQYSDDNGANYTDLDTTSPQVTGLSAYFTNDGVEGEMTYSTTIDPDKTFDFEAKTTNANYKFVGWFMEDGTKITTDNASNTERSGSYTFVAKFMQVQSGQLILSHSADKGTISGTNYQGSGTAKIGVVVKNGDGETVRTYDLTTSDITLDDKVIKSDSTNTIEVTLEATATGYDEYGTTVLATPSGQDSTYFSSKSDSTSGKTKTIVLNSFTVASLFSGTTQNVKNIIYHSYFREAEFNYKLTFAFNDRFGNAKNYIKQGKLTSNQAANTKYVKVINGKTCLLPEFYSTLAPHESNFGKDFEWLMTSNLEFTHSGSVYTCIATISSNQTTGKRTATFNLPYAHTNGVPSSYGVMDKASVTNLVIENIDYGSLVKNKKDNDNFVTAPRQLSDEGTTKNFLYWSIASTLNPNKEVSRCYYYKFNFVMYDNYIITPVYENSESVLGSKDPLPSISFLQSTRNQYNADSNDTSAVNGKALDYVFNDFVMSFDYNNIEIFKADETSNSITQLGYVVERVQKLEPKQDGTPYTDPTHYSDKNLKTVEQIKTWIENNKDNTDVVKDGKTLTRFTVNKSDLDNKNRVEFYEAYLNSKEWNSTDQTFARKSADKNYVYKAYTYMIVNGEVYLSDPAYFTMYEEATKK